MPGRTSDAPVELPTEPSNETGDSAEHRSRRHRSHHPVDTDLHNAHTRHRRLRLIYFSIASLSGFLVGTLALLVGMAAFGEPLAADSRIAMLIFGAAVLSVLGGAITARAYRNAARF